MKNYKQFNEGLNDLLKGPSKEEIWKNLGYDKTFDTPEDFFLDVIEGIMIKQQDEDYNIAYWEKNGKIIFERDYVDNALYVNSKIWNILYGVFNIKNRAFFIKNILEEYLHWKGLSSSRIWRNEEEI